MGLAGLGSLAGGCCCEGGEGPGPIIDGCNACIDGFISQFYQVELQGIEEGCGECDSLNATYIVEITETEPTACYGDLDIDGACEDNFDDPCYRQMRLRFAAATMSLGVLCTITIGRRPSEPGVGECANVTSIVWSKRISEANTPADCIGLDEEEIPYTSRTGVVAYCPATSSVALISAL